jgi:hypothetical protein
MIEERAARRWINAGLDATLGACWLIHAVLCLRDPLVYIPDDGLFYLQIAFAASRGEGFAFTDITPTNGYHPLWAWLCTLLGLVSADKAALLALSSVVVVLLNGVTLFALRRFLARYLGDPLPSGAVLVGAPFLLFVGFGMESSLAVCLLVGLLFAAARALQRPGAGRLYVCAGVAGLVVAARLDLMLVIAPLCASVAARYRVATGKRPGVWAWRLALAAALGSVPTGVFLLRSQLQFGDPRPVSGVLKLAVSARLEQATPPDGIVLLLLGIVLAGAAATAGRPRDTTRDVVRPLVLGQLVFLAWVWLVMRVEIGGWYFASSCVVSAVTGSVAWRALPAHWASGTHRRLLQALLFLLCVSGSGAMMLRYGRGRSDDVALTPGGAAGLGAVARQFGVRRVFTFDRPGELAFLDGLSVLAADGLTTNLPFQWELERRGFSWLLDAHEIDALVLPRAGGRYGESLCNTVYLHALRFACTPGTQQLETVELLSRLSGDSLGTRHVGPLPRLTFSPDRDLDVILLGSAPREPATQAAARTAP